MATALKRLRTQSGRGGKLTTTIPVPTRAPHRASDSILLSPRISLSLPLKWGKSRDQRREGMQSPAWEMG